MSQRKPGDWPKVDGDAWANAPGWRGMSDGEAVSDTVTVVLSREDAAAILRHVTYQGPWDVWTRACAALRTALDAPAPAALREQRWRCPDCGLGTRTDEDGLCVHCGADCEAVECEVQIRALPVVEAPRPEPVPEEVRVGVWSAWNQWWLCECALPTLFHESVGLCPDCGTLRPLPET